MILLIPLVLFLKLFQALLTLALGMMNDDNDDDVVMESPREDLPSLNRGGSDGQAKAGPLFLLKHRIFYYLEHCYLTLHIF